MRQDDNAMRQRLVDARIPPIAQTTTLALLGQALLRAVVNDRSYQCQGVPRNIAVVDATGEANGTFDRVCARFAAELTLSGVGLRFTTAEALRRELHRYELAGDHESSIDTVLTHSGFLFVQGIDYLSPEHRFGVLDYLANVMSSGRGVILCTGWRRSDDLAPEHFGSLFTPYFLSMQRYEAVRGARNV